MEIEIEGCGPMIHVKNIYYMLSYAFRSLQRDEYEKLGTEEFENAEDLLSTILIIGISGQIKRGLARDYMKETAERQSPTGKIDFSQTVAQNTLVRKKLICTYDIFSEDIYLNRIIKTTMGLLLRCSNVPSLRKKRIRKLLLFFENVQEIPAKRIQWKTTNRYHRNNGTYKMLLYICQLIVHGLIQSEDQDKKGMASFIDDQKMHALFEKFVLNYYRREHSNLQVASPAIPWDIPETTDVSFLPGMQSDIVLKTREKTLIIDTKYYSRSTQTNYNKTSLISANLYQIFTYVKNWNARFSDHVSGLLLYAKTDEAIVPDNNYMISGNLIAAKTIDLSQEWALIRGQLDSIPQQYLQKTDN